MKIISLKSAPFFMRRPLVFQILLNFDWFDDQKNNSRVDLQRIEVVYGNESNTVRRMLAKVQARSAA
jgi:hypothetical protein